MIEPRKSNRFLLWLGSLCLGKAAVKTWLAVKADTEQVEMGTKPVSDMALTQDKAQTGRLTPGSLHVIALYKQRKGTKREKKQITHSKVSG